MVEIGAGGGSIARVDAMGRIGVGPDSAGSEPGPVCYGRGGTAPTVTDADLLLGYLDAEFFLGGRMRLDRDRAASAIADLGGQLRLSAIVEAGGNYPVVDENIAAARVDATAS